MCISKRCPSLLCAEIVRVERGCPIHTAAQRDGRRNQLPLKRQTVAPTLSVTTAKPGEVTVQGMPGGAGAAGAGRMSPDDARRMAEELRKQYQK